jgi:hypothetical protein
MKGALVHFCCFTGGRGQLNVDDEYAALTPLELSGLPRVRAVG